MMAQGTSLTALVPRWVRFALRRLRAAPLFSLFTIATLAVAVAITTATYSLVHHLMGGHLGVPDRESLFSVYQSGRMAWITLPQFREIERQRGSFSHVAGWTFFQTSVGTTATTVLAHGEVVTGEYFDTLRVPIARGRGLSVIDDRDGGAPAAVLSAAAARRWFESEAGAIGNVIRIGGQPFTVVGIVKDTFRGPSSQGGLSTSSFWVPAALAETLSHSIRAQGGTTSDVRLRIVARLNERVPRAAVEEETRAIGRSLNLTATSSEEEGLSSRGLDWTVGPALPDRAIPRDTVGRVIVAMPALVFLIACTNIANLALSRGVARRGSLAVRHALGATRVRLVREEMAESTIVAIVGGAVGLALAQWMLLAAASWIQERTSIGVSVFLPDLSLSGPIVAMSVGITSIALVVGGLLPSLSLTRHNLRDAMASNGDVIPRWRGRRYLIALQVSVSVGLFLVGFSALHNLPTRLIDSGPRLEGLAVATIPFAVQQYDEARARQTLNRIVTEMRRSPGVKEVAVVAGLSGRDAMLVPSRRRTIVTTPDRPFSSSHEGIGVTSLSGSAGMFDVLGIPLIAGSGFPSAGPSAQEQVVVVDEAVAIRLFGMTGVVGRTILVRTGFSPETETDALMRIVGVVQTRREDTRGGGIPEIYLPYARHFDPNVAVLVRGAGDAPPVGALREALRSDSSLAPAFIGDGAVLGVVEEVVLGSAVGVTYGLAAFALVLAMGGLYGVLSHVVSLRSREIAVRRTLGASETSIAVMVLRDGLRPVLQGLTFALGAAVLLGHLLRITIMGDLSPIDMNSFAMASVLVLIAGVSACFVPAWRASRLNPNEILKGP